MIKHLIQIQFRTQKFIYEFKIHGKHPLQLLQNRESTLEELPKCRLTQVSTQGVWKSNFHMSPVTILNRLSADRSGSNSYGV